MTTFSIIPVIFLQLENREAVVTNRFGFFICVANVWIGLISSGKSVFRDGFVCNSLLNLRKSGPVSQTVFSSSCGVCILVAMSAGLSLDST